MKLTDESCREDGIRMVCIRQSKRKNMSKSEERARLWQRLHSRTCSINMKKKSGMTGTALTEEKEFRDIYGMDVVEIPTNRPVQRKDLEDAVYKTKKEKYHAVVEAVKEAHATGQPVLVGTITIEVSELLSKMLKKEGIQHKVLNAKIT